MNLLNPMNLFKTLAVVALAVLGSAATAQDAVPVARRLLYITHMAGFKHSAVPLSEQVMKDLGAANGFEVVVTRDMAALEADNLKKFDGVMFNTTGELPATDDQKVAFLAFVRSGKGFVGVHSATDTFYKWPEYGVLIGGYFDGHPWHQEVAIVVEDPKHPSTAHLPAKFTITDEIYQFKDWSRDTVRVLLRLDPEKVDWTKKGIKRTDKDFAIAWTKTFGKGRVFYTALGHREDVWRDERVQKHLLGGLRWAIGDPRS
jgi:type 1 glutamine amidotransferase